MVRGLWTGDRATRRLSSRLTSSVNCLGMISYVCVDDRNMDRAGGGRSTFFPLWGIAKRPPLRRQLTTGVPEYVSGAPDFYVNAVDGQIYKPWMEMARW